MNARIGRYQGEIADLCRRWQVTELALFGSVLRDELGGVLGRPTELVERSAVEASRNYIRRAEILQSAEAVYAA